MNISQENYRLIYELKVAVRLFYEAIGSGEILLAYLKTDPILASPANERQFIANVSRFLEVYGTVSFKDVAMWIHLGEDRRLYNGRDYAIGSTHWVDAHDIPRKCFERWVRTASGSWVSTSLFLEVY